MIACLLAILLFFSANANAQTWTDVTPAGICLGADCTAAGVGNNFGPQGAAADTTRAGVVYCTATYQGLYKSTNYGLTWSKVTVSGDDPLQNGRGQLRVAPDGSYLLTTALYPIAGYSNGAWKSTDGGVTWTRYNVGAPNGDDMGAFEILSSDKNRVIGVSHSSTFNLYESRDAGQTWTDQGTIGATNGADALWLDANTIIAIGDGDNGAGPGTYRGVRSSSTWPWTWTWTHVSTQQHWHGTSQIFVDTVNSAVFTGGGYGVQKSTDNGVNWTVVSSTYSGGIVGTTTKLYSTASYASQAGFGPYLQHATRNPGTSWTDDTGPGGMNNGWLYASVMCNGSTFIIVSGNWNAGIWRLDTGESCSVSPTVTSKLRLKIKH